MKRNSFKSFLVSIFVLVLLFSSGSNIQSQENLTFDQAYTNYTTQLEEYQRAHNKYVLARSQYLSFQTLAAQEQAYDATLTMLQERNDVVISYLEALRERLEATPGISDSVEEGLRIRINTEIDFFRQHTSRLPSTGSLGDLVEDSNEARDRYEIINPLFYETFSVISYGKVNDYHDRLVDIFSASREKFETIRNEEREEYRFDDEKILTIDRWLTESDQRIVRSQQKLSEAEQLISLYQAEEQPRGRRLDPPGRYNEILNVLEESRLHMKEATSFIKEVIREIKTD